MMKEIGIRIFISNLDGNLYCILLVSWYTSLVSMTI